jgi:hypothetical protein
MVFYIPVLYLKLIHYFYFSVGIFSFASAFVFGFYPSYALFFVVSYIVNSAISWYMSWWLYKRLKKQIIINSWKYVINHLIVTGIVMGVLAIVVLSNVMVRDVSVYNPVNGDVTEFKAFSPEIMDVFLTFNYFTLFLAIIWSLMLRFDFISKFFMTYNRYTLNKGKNVALKLRSKYGSRLKSILPDSYIKDYKPGTVEKVDNILMSIVKINESDEIRMVAELEMFFAEQRIMEMRKRIENLKSNPNMSVDDIRMAAEYEQMVTTYAKDIVRYQKTLDEILQAGNH